MAEPMSYGGLESGAPLSGLGNFKGVMLCNRPSDGPTSKLGGGGEGPTPFKSMVAQNHGEQLGLPPAKKEEGSKPEVKKRGPSAALRQHVRWLRELQDQMQGERDMVDDEERNAEARKQKLKAIAAKHREGVRQMLEERDVYYQQPGASKKPATTKASKPLWAMTAQEKDVFEDEEADSLISFAENLDFDKYVGDLEFKTGVEAMRDRAGKLQKEQDAFKDALLADFNSKLDEDDEETSAGGSPRSLNQQDGVDGQSLFGDVKSEYSVSSSRRSKGADRYNKDGKPDWDACTSCGDGPQVDHTIKDQASQILESHSQIRAVHSKGSVSKLVEKARQAQTSQPRDLVEHMQSEGPVTAPKITASEDTQQRLHKPPDPSQLPYLYRSPAI